MNEKLKKQSIKKLITQDQNINSVKKSHQKESK